MQLNVFHSIDLEDLKILTLKIWVAEATINNYQANQTLQIEFWARLGFELRRGVKKQVFGF